MTRFTMLAVIITESRDVSEFARRAEAWSATESHPPTDGVMAARWRAARGGMSKGAVVGLIVHARRYRVEARNRLFESFIESAPSPSKKGKNQ